MEQVIEIEVTLKEFYQMLEHHDWHYNHSDDFQTWLEGSKMQTYLESIARRTEEHFALFSAFKAHKFQTGAPKPELPKED